MIVFLFVIEGLHLQKQRNEMNKLINIKSSSWGRVEYQNSFMAGKNVTHYFLKYSRAEQWHKYTV